MDDRLKKVVEESLSLSVELDFVTLGENYPFAQPEIGDEIPVIDETIDFNRALLKSIVSSITGISSPISG